MNVTLRTTESVRARPWASVRGGIALGDVTAALLAGVIGTLVVGFVETDATAFALFLLAAWPLTAVAWGLYARDDLGRASGIAQTGRLAAAARVTLHRASPLGAH